MEGMEPAEIWQLSAAVGWLELGNIAEAKAELAKLAPSRLEIPDVLEVRWAIEAHERNWDAALPIARTLVENDPARPSGWLHRSYALRRASGGGLQAAWDALLPALDRFPDEPTIPYNLACYACQMGDLDQARILLRRSLEIGGKKRIKTMALADLDLEPLWKEIGAW